jgi:hypothetical protein
MEQRGKRRKQGQVKNDKNRSKLKKRKKKGQKNEEEIR